MIRQTSRMLLVSIFLVTSATFQEASECTFELGFEAKKFKLKKTDTFTMVFRNAQSQGNNIPNLDFKAGKEYVCCRQSTSRDYQSSDCQQLIYVSHETPANDVIIDVEQSKASKMSDNSSFTSSDNEKFYYHEDGSGSFAFCKLEVSSNSVGKTISIAIKQSSAILVEIEDPASETSALVQLAYDYKDANSLAEYSNLAGQAKYYFKPEVAGEVSLESLVFSIDASNAIEVATCVKANLKGETYFIRPFQATLNTKSTRKFYPALSGFSVRTGITSATQSLSINNLRFSGSPPAQYQMRVLQNKSKLLVLETSKKSLSLIPFQKSPSGFKLLHNISTDVIQFVDSNDSFVTLKTKPGTKTLSISMWYSDVAGERTVQFIPYEFSPIVGKAFTCFVSGSAKDGFALYNENFAVESNINQCLTDGFVFQHGGKSTALNSADLQLELKQQSVNQQYRFGLTHKNNGNYVFQDIDLAVRTPLDGGANGVGAKSVKYLRNDNGWLDEISLDSSPITDRALKYHAGTDSITLNLSDDYSFSEHSLDLVVDDLIALSETKDSTRDLHVNIFSKRELRNTPPDCLRVGPNSYERRVNSSGIGKCSNLQEANKKSLGGGVIEIEFHQPVCYPILSNINATTATFLWQIENYTRSRVAIPIQLGSGSSAQAQNVTNFECKNRFGTVVSKTPITIKIVQNDSGLEIGSFDFLKEKFEKNQSGFKLSESKESGVTSALFYRESMPAITLEFKEIKYTGRTCIAISGDDLFLMKSRNFGKLATEKECRIDPNIKSKTIGNIKNNFERLVGLDNKMKIYPEGKKLSGNPYIELNLEESTSIDQLIQGTSKYYIQKTTRGLNKEYKVFIFADEARSYVEIVTFKSMLFLHVINLGVVVFVCIAAITLLLYLKHRGDFERHIDDYRCYCRSLLNSSYQASSIADQKLAAAGRSSTESSSQFGVSELLRPHPISDAPQLLLLAQSIKQSPPQMEKFALALGAAHDTQKQALAGRTASKNFELMPYESPNLPYTLHMLRGTETNVDVNTFKRLFKMVRSQVAVVQKSFLGQFGHDTDSTTRDCVIAKLDDFPSCYFIGTDSITDECLLRILNFIENDRSISSVLLLHMKDMDSHILATAIESISTRSLKAADYVINPLSKAMWMTAFAQKDLEPEPSIHYCTEVFKILKGVEIEPFFELKKQMKAVQNPGNSIWRKITRIRTHSTQVGKLTANHRFNRYTDIVPYDHSRVVLKPTLNGSDYINASHIDITLNGRSYHFYAFQAPLEHTVDAFWTAIWQEGISCMIKLTRNKERGVNKCFEYVPFKGQASKLGDQGFSFRIAADDCGSQITITLLSIAEFQNITVQLFRMSSEPPTDVLDDDTSSANSRPRTMYHTNISFHAWADHGVPAMPELERLLYLNINPVTAMPDIDPRVHECLLRAAREQKNAVHCSAGVGRTGVLIVLLCMMYEARQGCKEFNIADCVDQMRDCRNTMVQTSDQFKCLYENAQVILLNAIGD